MKLTDLEIDVDKLEQGDWVENIPDMGDLRLKVRGSENADFRALQQKLLRAVPRGQLRDGRVPPEVSDRITATLLLETVLLDWDGLVGGNDEPIPYSKEMAAKLLTDPKYRRFRNAVAWAADVVAERTKEDDEAMEGNSSASSSGVSKLASRKAAG
jgi:hypothetical protein